MSNMDMGLEFTKKLNMAMIKNRDIILQENLHKNEEDMKNELHSYYDATGIPRIEDHLVMYDYVLAGYHKIITRFALTTKLLEVSMDSDIRLKVASYVKNLSYSNEAELFINMGKALAIKKLFDYIRLECRFIEETESLDWNGFLEDVAKEKDKND